MAVSLENVPFCGQGKINRGILYDKLTFGYKIWGSTKIITWYAGMKTGMHHEPSNTSKT